MGFLWLPEEARAKIDEEATSQAEAIRVREFSRRLEAFDPRCRLSLATQDSPDGEVRQGFYYIVRHNEDGTVAAWMVSDEDAFREPDERDIEALRQLDLRNPARVREMRERKARVLREREAEKAREADERLAEIDELLTFHTRAQISVPRAA